MFWRQPRTPTPPRASKQELWLTAGAFGVTVGLVLLKGMTWESALSAVASTGLMLHIGVSEITGRRAERAERAEAERRHAIETVELWRRAQQEAREQDSRTHQDDEQAGLAKRAERAEAERRHAIEAVELWRRAQQEAREDAAREHEEREAAALKRAADAIRLWQEAQKAARRDDDRDRDRRDDDGRETR